MYDENTATLTMNKPSTISCIHCTTAHIGSIGNVLIEIPDGVVWVSSSQLGSLVNWKVLDALVSLSSAVNDRIREIEREREKEKEREKRREEKGKDKLV